MKEKFTILIKEHKFLFVSLISALLLLSIVSFFLIYNSDSNKTKRNLKHMIVELNEVNASLEDGIKDMTIDTNKSYELLISGSNKLKELLSSLSEVENVNAEVSSMKNDLNNALLSTINLYDNCIYILSNPKDIRSSSDLDTFNNLKEKCLKDYSIVNESKIRIELSDKTLEFFNNTYNYVNTLIKLNRDSEFQNTKQREFIIKLESFKSTIDTLNEDLIPAINKIREDKRDLQVIIDDLYKKEKSYESLKKEVISLSIPDGFMNIYNSLDEYLKIYHIYLKSIKEAVIYEKTCSDISKYSKEIDKNYQNASSKRNDVLDAYYSYKNNLQKN
ncbi:hypothetical protein UT300007_30640 [Clostridium sp. CTA-7]